MAKTILNDKNNNAVKRFSKLYKHHIIKYKGKLYSRALLDNLFSIYVEAEIHEIHD